MLPPKLLLEFMTVYGTYDIVDEIYAGRPARVLYNGGRSTAQSGLARDARPEQLFDYNERFMELLRGKRPANVLLIGGGAFVLLQAIIREFPDTRLTVIEIDGRLPRIAQDYFGFVPSASTIVQTCDGLDFLAHTTETYDLILLDVFQQAIIPAGFRTAAFAHQLRSHSTDNGCVAMNIIAAYHGKYATLLRHEITALRTAFTDIQLYPASHGYSLWLPQNFVLTAQANSSDLQSLLRYQAIALSD